MSRSEMLNLLAICLEEEDMDPDDCLAVTENTLISWLQSRVDMNDVAVFFENEALGFIAGDRNWNNFETVGEYFDWLERQTN